MSIAFIKSDFDLQGTWQDKPFYAPWSWDVEVQVYKMWFSNQQDKCCYFELATYSDKVIKKANWKVYMDGASLMVDTFNCEQEGKYRFLYGFKNRDKNEVRSLMCEQKLAKIPYGWTLGMPDSMLSGLPFYGGKKFGLGLSHLPSLESELVLPQSYQNSELSSLPPLVSAPEPIEESKTDSEDCVVCMASVRTHIILPCMHWCLCHVCAETKKEELKNCPICRGIAEAIKKVFR